MAQVPSVVATHGLADGGIDRHQGSVRRASGIDRCWVGGRRIRHQSAQKKHGDVVIDLDAWLRAILASIYALLVAGERAPLDNQICAGNEWRDLNREQPLLGNCVVCSRRYAPRPDQWAEEDQTRTEPC